MLGEFILTKFKKKDISKQAIHNTDVARLSYVIKELMLDDTSEWIIDKRGIKATKYMITPLLKHIKKICREHQKQHTQVDPEDYTKTLKQFEVMNNNCKTILDIINDIDDGKLAKKIHMYIAPKLMFDKNIIKELEQREIPVLSNENNTLKKEDYC